jgi:chromosome segregation ATPase
MKKINDTKPEADLTPEQTQASFKSDKPKLGHGRRIWRTALIWMVVIAAALLIGLLADHFMRYKPTNETLLQTQSELSQANLNNNDLKARLATVDDKIATLESTNQTLQSELDSTKAHLELLKVLVDVSNARIALFLDDVEGAKAALTNTPQRLENLSPSIAEYDTSLAQSMPQRLNLIVSGLARDVETAKIDLELFTKDLLEVEAAIFGD